MSTRRLDQWLRGILEHGRERWRISHVRAVAHAERLAVTWEEIEEAAERVGVYEHYVGGCLMWCLVDQTTWDQRAARVRRCLAFA